MSTERSAENDAGVDPIAERLTAFRDRYTNRRTVPWELLSEATHLVAAAQEYHARIARAEVAQVEDRLAVLEEQHARELERAEERATRQRERAERAEAAEKAYRQQQTNLREQRETVNDGVQVRISAPTFRNGDRDLVRPWTLGELETVIYRLRAGGAEDDTEVRFAREHVEACIPYPEMVIEPRTQSRAEAVLPATARNAATWRPDWRLALGLALVALSVLLGAVIL